MLFTVGGIISHRSVDVDDVKLAFMGYIDMFYTVFALADFNPQSEVT